MLLSDPKTPMPSTPSKIHSSAAGRRKSSVAAVRLMSAKEDWVINNKKFADYFTMPGAKIRYEKPFEVTKTLGKYSVSVRANGGGQTGQLDAVVLGISRALVELKDEYKTLLKKEGLLTRDPRTRQRRNIGMGGKSRRKKSSPKR